MRILSTCPACGKRFPRWWYFKCFPHVRYACPKCKATVQTNSKWEWIGDLALGVPCGLILTAALLGFIAWPTAIAISLFIFAAGWVMFPYATPFDLVEQKRENSGEQGAEGDAVNDTPQFRR